jgi:PAS domain S-box-containing protein
MERAEFEQWRPREVARLLALMETERRYYQEIVANLPVGILIVGADHSVVSANRYFRLRTSLKNEELRGKALGTVLPGDELSQLVKEVLAGARPSTRVPLELTLGGKANRFEASVFALRNWEEDSELEAVIALEEAQAVVALPAAPVAAPIAEAPIVAATPAFSDELLTQLQSSLWEASAETRRFLYVSPNIQQWTGYDPEQLRLRADAWTARIAPEDRSRMEVFFWRLREKGGSAEADFRLVDARGSHLPVREIVRFVPATDKQEARFVGLITPNASRRQTEAQHAQTLRMEALQRLSARVSHDVNNLLMIITGYSDDLRNSLPPGSPLYRDVQEILGAANRLQNFSAQLQSYTRKPILLPEVVTLQDALNRCRFALQRALGEEAEVKVVDVQPALRLNIDLAQLELVLLHLAEFLRRHNPQGVSIVIEPGAVDILNDFALPLSIAPGEYVSLRISDRQSDISAEVQARLFEPWAAEDDSGRNSRQALAYSWTIVRQSGGDISVSTLPGGGTMFHLFLPRVADLPRTQELPELPTAAKLEAKVPAAPPPPRIITLPPAPPAPRSGIAAPPVPTPVVQPPVAPLPVAPPPVVAPPVEAKAEPQPEVKPEAKLEATVAVPAPAAPASPSAARTAGVKLETILVVDDEPGIRALVRKILWRQGYTVMEAGDGPSALELLKEHQGPVDLLVTDVMMPEMNGRELAELALSFRQDLRVLFVSGYTDDAMLSSGNFPPGTGCLTKPFTLGSLLGRVREVLDARGSQGAHA